MKNWKMLLILVAVIGIGMTIKEGSFKRKAFQELPIVEQDAIRGACWNEWMRVQGQVKWRQEQAHLYRRWEAVKMYEQTLSKLEDIRQLLGDKRSDPNVLHEDIQRIVNGLKSGQ